ncbi:NADH dehydrogenase [ubiquinone] 1 alpha subcomplex subunit 2-like [Arachis duranensis]|uniref:NADH dehydrogenase [ubiquinone] 1 alpha subcomplex subunit 2-like n=1 Tax=Arachis duranensis TaxID=130453 RepID=A0A9C6TJY6_ARADU|nr:NADH dehydrogenase [ubiquinone] 1 alpha subcomplex subunit 2-like [Arachis hypogaea]XP_052110143.1 NADH dehydrogenase [ubiquinone] 1 alpha subcomplex subunit 2-like [Arachis duranensis]
MDTVRVFGSLLGEEPKLTGGTFVEKNYKELKTLNPKLPILIRECSGAEPQLWARFDFGVEKGIKLEGLSEAQISKALEDLVKAGEILKA